MNKRVVAVMVCTLLALGAVTTRVPCRDVRLSEGLRHKVVLEGGWVPADSGGPTVPFSERTVQPVFTYYWLWDIRHPARGIRIGNLNASTWSIREIWWMPVFVTQALILLLGGGLLTFVVRRERRGRPIDAA